MDCPASMHGITSLGNSVAAAGPSLSRTKLTLQVGQKKKLTVRGEKDPKMQLPVNGSKDCIGWQERDC